jgi:hypothetical protein
MSVSRRRKMTLIAVIASIAVFCASAFAAGINISGYEKLKAAGFQYLENIEDRNGFYSNGAFWINASVYIDGAVFYGFEQTLINDGARSISRNKQFYADAPSFGDSYFAFKGNNDIVTYSDDEVNYRWYGDNDFSEYPNYRFDYKSSRNGNFNGDDTDPNIMPPAQKRFIEAVMDALVGETRNYFVVDGNIITISLSGNQIPELAQYAIAAMAERIEKGFASGGADFYIGSDARFTNGILKVELDDEGYAVGGYITFEILSTVNGAQQSFRIEAEIVSQDIGTTEVVKPDGNAYGRPVLPEPGGEGAPVVTYLSNSDFI